MSPQQRTNNCPDARLYFDGGSRGNPGIGGSGWVVLYYNEHEQRWGIRLYGYTYQGPMQTNNWCEYKALEEGLARCPTEFQHQEMQIDVYGDSEIIIAIHKGQVQPKQPKVTELAKRVETLSSKFDWITWHHTRRNHNKMEDHLADVVMDTKQSAACTGDPTPLSRELLEKIQTLMTS